MPVTIDAIQIEKILDKGYATEEQAKQMLDAGYILHLDRTDIINNFHHDKKYYRIKAIDLKKEKEENKLIENENQELIYRQILEANQMILAYVENIDTRLKAIEGKFL